MGAYDNNTLQYKNIGDILRDAEGIKDFLSFLSDPSLNINSKSYYIEQAKELYNNEKTIEIGDILSMIPDKNLVFSLIPKLFCYSSEYHKNEHNDYFANIVERVKKLGSNIWQDKKVNALEELKKPPIFEQDFINNLELTLLFKDVHTLRLFKEGIPIPNTLMTSKSYSTLQEVVKEKVFEVGTYTLLLNSGRRFNYYFLKDACDVLLGSTESDYFIFKEVSTHNSDGILIVPRDKLLYTAAYLFEETSFEGASNVLNHTFMIQEFIKQPEELKHSVIIRNIVLDGEVVFTYPSIGSKELNLESIVKDSKHLKEQLHPHLLNLGRMSKEEILFLSSLFNDSSPESFYNKMLDLTTRTYKAMVKLYNAIFPNININLMSVDFLIDEDKNPVFCELDFGPNISFLLRNFVGFRSKLIKHITEKFSDRIIILDLTPSDLELALALEDYKKNNKYVDLDNLIDYRVLLG